MRSFREIKQNYRFMPEDEKRLQDMRPLMEEHVDEVMSTLSLWIMGTTGAAKFTDESQSSVPSVSGFLSSFRDYETGTVAHSDRRPMSNKTSMHYMNRAQPCQRPVGIMQKIGK
jgi:hypothetical protein